MATRNDDPSARRVPERGEPTIPEIEADDTIAPRPEEEIADAARAEPDLSEG